MRSTIVVGLLIFVLIFSTVSFGIIRMVRADLVIGNPIVASKGPHRDLFDPDNGLIYVASGAAGITTGNNTGPPGSIVTIPPGASIAPPTSNTMGTPPPGSIVKISPGTTSVQSTNNNNGSPFKLGMAFNTGSTPSKPGCGPGTDNSTCSTNNNNNQLSQRSTITPSTPTPTVGCGPGTDNSTCSSTSFSNPSQPTAGSSTGLPSSNNAPSNNSPSSNNPHSNSTSPK